MLTGKKILLGITGSIAAYKAAYLIRLLTKSGAEVRVVMTPAAKDFITPLTLATLSKHPVYSVFVSDTETGTWNNHVDLGIWADLMIIAPATAASIAKMATGTSDNFLLAVYLSARCPVCFAPAMDLDMYKHPATQENIRLLINRGNKVIPAETGELASGLHGEGRMADPETIFEEILSDTKNNQPLSGKTLLVSAGPTYEPIDPVRFIGNWSSGKMGFAIAEEAAAQGAQVKLVAGPVPMEIKHSNIERIDVTTSEEMYKACNKYFPSSDITIMAAAIADFKPKTIHRQKIKKEKGTPEIKLTGTKDILDALGKKKRQKQLLVGFALETKNEERNAEKKLKNKNLDFVVLNSLRKKGAGFGYDTNQITIIDKQRRKKSYPLKQKAEVAKDIIQKVIELTNA